MSGAAVRRIGVSVGLAVTFYVADVSALTFDVQGRAKLDTGAVVSESFEGAVDPSNPAPFGIDCPEGCSYDLIDEAYGPKELALHGRQYVRTSTPDAPFEVELALPKSDRAFRFHIWVRHARVRARVLFEHTTSRGDDSAHMFPSGRVTSDGWVELVSNSVSVSGGELERARLRIEGTAVDLDGFEVVAAGSYSAGSACLGAFDPVCGDQAVCIAERCREGDRYVPPLPRPEHRKSIAEYLMGRVRNLFGGRLSRTRYMPVALAEMRKMEAAETAWDYWSAFSRGVRLLNDWHTSLSFPMPSSSPRALAVCFIEGRADLSQTIWPSAPHRADILVSHVGPQNTLGLKPGDRLVAVDGRHPLDWARALVSVNPSHHAATDPDVDAEFAENMRSLIPRFARNFSVVRCSAQPLSCADVIETIEISELPVGTGFGPNCDNRPSYHQLNPPSATVVPAHFFFEPWRDLVVDSRPGEAIYGMTWDTLFGRGRLSSGMSLTDYFLSSNQFFKQNARGVILDHRAGNGGTIDAPQAITQLVRPPFALSVGPGFMAVAAYDGPASTAEGKSIFDRFRTYSNLLYEVGSNGADTSLPVALLIHRDGSASDWLPHGMKGAPKVRIFGPHETAGAFSSFYQYSYWSRFDFQLASGDTINYLGEPLIGHGIEPDEIVEHTQSALLQGKDLPYEAALEWVRANLK